MRCLYTLVAVALAGSASAQSIAFRAGPILETDGGARGVAVHDYDGDGHDDIFLAVLRGTSVLFRNQGDGTFAETALQVRGTFNVALWGDINRDGTADLYLGGLAQERVLLQQSDGTFHDATAQMGLEPGATVATAAMADYDADGYVDIFAAVVDGPDRLYRNMEATRFEDVAARAGVQGASHSRPMQAIWHDYDGDGSLDLFCVHDGRERSRLYRNTGSFPFQDRAVQAGIDVYPAPQVCCNMGVAWGDVDGDGTQDAYVTRIAHGGLFIGRGDGTFVDEAEQRGAHRNGMSWGVVMSDFDNDADLDLFVVSTSSFDGTPTLLYRNDGGAFTETGRQAGVSFQSESQGLAAGDFNGDGLQDLVVPTANGRHRILVNATEGAGHYLGLRLRGGVANPTAIGVRAQVVAGRSVQERMVSGGDSFASQSSAALHFGLGSQARVDTLRVYWGAGSVTELTDLSANSTYVLTEGLASTGLVVPDDFSPVVGNHPNPFRDATRITFSLSRASRVRIDVFDILGRSVSTLMDERREAGPHGVRFAPGNLPDGLYVYRLVADGHIEIGTMLRVR